MHLNPTRVEEYLKAVMTSGGRSLCWATMCTVMAAHGKFLQIMVGVLTGHLQHSLQVSYYLEEPDKVASHMEQFNEYYAGLTRAYRDVTGQEFGQTQPEEPGPLRFHLSLVSSLHMLLSGRQSRSTMLLRRRHYWLQVKNH